MSTDQVHPPFTSTTPECIVDLALWGCAPPESSKACDAFRDLQNRVIGELANSALCAQSEKFSRDARRTCGDPGFWCVSSGDAAVFDGERVEIGAFGKFNLTVEPDQGEVK